MQAQDTTTITGEYYLQGVMETASGFKLNHDSTFQFFFSYGALDRTGKGTWKLKNDKIIFNSPSPAGQNFALIKHTAVMNDLTTIKITDENKAFISQVYAIVKSGNKRLEALSDEQGEIHFPKQPVDSIVLVFEFCTERAAVFAFTNKADNYFEFRFEPWIMDVFFENLALTLEDKGFKGQHPLLKEGEYHFIKN